MSRFISLVFVAICTSAFAQSQQMPAADTTRLDFRQFGLLAIQENGRRKPVDTFSKETLIRLTGRSTYTDKSGRSWTPNDFLLSALIESHDWKNEPMLLVSFGKLKEQLGVETTTRRFSFSQLSGSVQLQRISNEARALKRAERPLDRLQQEAIGVSDRLALFAHVMDGNLFQIVPAAKSETEPWLIPEPGLLAQSYGETKSGPAISALTQMMRAYATGDEFNFSSNARQLRENLRALSPAIYPTESQLRIEYFYNHFDGFYRAAWCYGIALLVLIVAHVRKTSGWLRNAGVAIAVVGLLFHASAIVMRCLIAGRPPVTNMYESIIWVSFAVSFFGMIFFARYRAPVYLLAALPVH